MPYGPDYVTVADFKSWLRVDPDDDDDDTHLQRAVTAACRAVDEHCNRQFGLVPAPVEYVADVWGRDECGRWLASLPDLMTTTGLVVVADGSTVAAESYVLQPRNAAFRERPWTSIAVDSGTRGDVVVTGRWGWSAVPAAVAQATLLQASRFLIRRDSPFGIAGSPDNGNELRLLARVDADVAVSLRGYRRPRGVA